MTALNVLDPNLATQSPVRLRALRSVGAVLGGLVATFIVTTAVDIAMHALGIYPAAGTRMADSLFLVALGYASPSTSAAATLQPAWHPRDR